MIVSLRAAETAPATSRTRRYTRFTPFPLLSVKLGAAAYGCHVAPAKLDDSLAWYSVGLPVAVLFSATTGLVVLVAPPLSAKVPTTGTGWFSVIVSLRATETAPATSRTRRYTRFTPFPLLSVKLGAAAYGCHVAPAKLDDSLAWYSVGLPVAVLFSATTGLVVLVAPPLSAKVPTTGTGWFSVIVSLRATETAPATSRTRRYTRFTPFPLLSVKLGAAAYGCHVAPAKLDDSLAWYSVGLPVAVLFSATTGLVVLVAPPLSAKVPTTGTGWFSVIVSLRATETAPATSRTRRYTRFTPFPLLSVKLGAAAYGCHVAPAKLDDSLAWYSVGLPVAVLFSATTGLVVLVAPPLSAKVVSPLGGGRATTATSLRIMPSLLLRT